MHALSRCAATALLLLAVPVDGKAQDYPTRPVTIIVPLTVAGAPDILARIIAQQLQARLGGSFVVENRAGGGTTIGSNAVAKAAPDGYTLLMATSSSLAINVTLQKALPYHPLNDFVPIAAVAQSPFILIVNPTVPAKTVAELIGYAKSNPDKLSFASAGNGTPHHLFAEMFMSMTGAKLPQARYRGSAPALNDLIAGHVTVMFCDVPSSAAAIGAGTVRALGVTTRSRLPGFPEVPPIAESGLPGFEGAAWLMIAAPAKTPEPVARKLNAEINAILELPATKEQLVKLNLTAMNIPSIADMREFVKSEIGRWGEVVRRAGIEKSELPE